MRKDYRASRPALKRISTGGLVLALMALFGLPTAAFAAGETVVSSDGVTVTVQAAAGLIKNQVSLSDLGANLGVRDSLADVTAGPGCTDPAPPGGQVLCTDATVTTIVVNLGGENDVLIPGGFSFAINASGGAGNDNVQGSNGSDTLDGGPGNDTLNGRLGGGDIYIGGTEKDEVTYSTRGNPVTVTADGVAANDGEALEGDNVGNDVEVITGGSANDSLTGGSGDNTLKGGNGDDTLHGGAGDDTLVGGLGGDDLFGDGNTAVGDTVSYHPESRAVSVTAGSGANDDGVIDVESGTVGNQSEGDTVDADIENISGGFGADFLVGSAGAGSISGNGGNDFLNGGTGTANDVMNGGAGIDTVSYAGRTNPVTVSLDGVAGDGEGAESDNVAVDVENVTGGDGNDTLTGNDSVNVLTGGDGNDTLNGLVNNDRLVGGLGDDIFNGGAGTDVADYSAETAAVTVTIDGVADDGVGAQTDNVGISTENVIGGTGNDDVTGSASNNTLNGGAGDDTLLGGSGNDILNGQDGDDHLFGQAGSDTLNGSLGADEINGGIGGGDFTSYAGRSSAVNVNLNIAGGDGEAFENDDVHVSVERITGTPFADTLRGESTGVASNPNILNGGGGNDTVNGGDGNDTVNGGDGNDIVTGGLGRDNLVGAGDADTFHANDNMRDSISCGPGVDNFSDRDVPLDVVSASCP